MGGLATLVGAIYTPYVAQIIAADELAAAERLAEDAQQHEKELLSGSEQIEAAKAVTEAGNRYIFRQTHRILACADRSAESCRSADAATLDAQFKLRNAAEVAGGVLGPKGAAQLEVVESFFPHLYDDNTTGVPPDEPVNDAAYHEAAVLLIDIAKEPRP